MRVDKWLWAARMFKHRAQATQACLGGHVKVNGASVKPAKHVQPGDHVDAVTPGGPRMLEVAALSTRRGPAAEAAKLYVDHTPVPEVARDDGVKRDRGAGRPSKRERRKLQEWLDRQR